MRKRVMFRVLFTILVIGCLTAYGQSNDQTNQEKSKEQVDAIIANAGSTSPDWWDSVELSYPDNLDLSWPVRQQGFQMGGRGGRGGRGFNQGTPTNVDDYLTQVINPNTSRYKEGIKLVNHLMIMHKDDEQKLQRSLNTLGNMFYDLLDDYARAAFWWQQYEKKGGSVDSMKMARCYFELGSKATAIELLSDVTLNYDNRKDLIKLWAKIGEVDKALGMIDTTIETNTSNYGRSGFGGGTPARKDNYLLAAEILKVAGRYDEALSYYEKVLALPDSETRAANHHDIDGKVKANHNIEAVKLLKQLDMEKVPDCTYIATVGAYGGNMTVQIVINDNSIESLDITQHRETPLYLTMAEPTARQIVSKQGFEGVDVITGATVTSNGIIHAAAKALVNAME